MKDLSVVVPVFNESESIDELDAMIHVVLKKSTRLDDLANL